MKNAIAKITGITPAGLTFRGRNVDCGAKVDEVLCRFAYWIGILRTACRMNTANAVIRRRNMKSAAVCKTAIVESSEPTNPCWERWMIAFGVTRWIADK